MGKIHLLSDDLKNKIAAGEVVERPASVVKELMENSIDAGATQIDINVKGGGNVSIQVTDNGLGMEKDDLLLSFQRHSTSKLDTPEDLHRIATLGFRGEALASIASVAQVKAQSISQGSENGYELVIMDGEFSDVNLIAMVEGTSVNVSDLFFSLPARRKFLKSPQTELRQIIQVVRRFTLSYPEVGFRLVSNNKDILVVKPETLGQRIGKVFDPTYSKNLLLVKLVKEPFHVSGYVGNLSLVRRRRGEQYLFLNRRFIVNRLLSSAIYSTFESLISRGEFPFFVLNIEMPLDQVDVNVHPMKIEVRFRDEWRVYHVLKLAVSKAIADILKTIPDFIPDTKISKGKVDSRPIPGQDIQLTERQQSMMRFIPTSTGRQDVERAKDYVRTFSSQESVEQLFDLENIWQVHSKYVVSPIKSGLVIIDQHVAHERILYEQAMEAVDGKALASQTLLFPQKVEFPPDDFSILLELLPYLQKIGFRMKESGENRVEIEGVPSEMGWGNEKEILKDIIDYYQDHHKEYASFREAIAISFACRAAIKAGDTLSKEEMQTLVDRLFATKHPYYCPHGRPIIVNLTLDELDKRFERK